jgi:tetratricopeptide (TPR) repeat protein
MDARLLAAKALSEQLQFDQAAELLFSNIYESSLSPQSSTWAESLFQLGTILYRQGDLLYVEANRLATQIGKDQESTQRLEASHEQLMAAIRRLEESVQRFGEDPRNLQTLYLVAQAYRHAAKWPEALLKKNQIGVEEVRRQKVALRRQLLQSALETYAKLRSRINASAVALNLDATQQWMLRNSYFGEADLHFEMEEYPSALTAYRSAANRFLNEPEALEALVQIAECHKRTGNKPEALRAIHQARQLLSRISSDLDGEFSERTRFDRPGWVRFLDWISTLQ